MIMVMMKIKLIKLSLKSKWLQHSNELNELNEFMSKIALFVLLFHKSVFVFHLSYHCFVQKV